MGTRRQADEKAEVLASRRVRDDGFLDLRVERVRLPGGHETDVEVVRHPGAAAVLPITADGEVVLVRQYRHPTGGWLLELPAGTLEPDEPPETCAHREIVEETGLRAGRLEALGWIYTTPGFCDETIWLYLARDLEPATQRLDADEVLSVERLPLAKAIAMAESGEIVDGKTVCALLRAARRGY